MLFLCSRHASRAVRRASGDVGQATPDLRRASNNLSLWLLAAAFLLAAAGCGGDSKSDPKSTGTTGKAAGGNEDAETHCESILTSIDDIFQIQRLGRTTAVSDGVARFNDWRRACAPKPATAVPQIPAEIRKLLSPEQRAALAESNFMLRDGEHVRDCMLEKAISSYAVGSAQGTELEKVTS